MRRMSSDFHGAKLAVLSKGQMLAFLRDDRHDIPWPGMWDLPGGGRERGETPLDCAIRETWEEAGLMVRTSDVVWQREYTREGQNSWFVVAEPGWLCLPPPRLGDEGQAVRWMPVTAFLELTDAVPHLQLRLREYLLVQTEGAHA
jgi:8-oxo-dGTP diphosphatase